MSTPQSGILPEGNSTACFIVATVNAGDEAARQARSACAAVPELTREVATIDPGAGLVSVVAVGSACWDRLYPGRPRPGALRPFRARVEGSRQAPATAGDLLFHIRSERRDLNYVLARKILAEFGESISIVEVVDGFRYLENRDLTGFVDGTENPEGDERAEVALVAQEDPGFSGGSYIHLQRYIHNLADWEALPVSRQESTIGRTKADDVELVEGVKPPTAHISRVVIEENGQELEILRHSMPYGDVREAGLLFIAYARNPDHFDRMLDNMIHTDADGHYDHLLDYTRAVTGCAFFAPSVEFLEADRVQSE
ncbi:MAG TPA: Dyp-type peroxidase [Gammaproteobacteria bacterium]|nr:Dyp-type peroxidase [Gammaproteobacteria bacterium]